ncbi:velvet factor [Gongronella butleri]|nr:velvet factor [Gongronella butleri]
MVAGEFKLSICQQPVHARSAGFGNRDRRLIDPSPILQLYKLQGNDYIKVRSLDAQVATMVVHCDLYDGVLDEPRHAVTVQHDSPPLDDASGKQQPYTNRTVVGTMVSNAHELEDLQGEKGVFFVFGDVSVRIEGHFRLKFQLLSLFQAHIYDVIFSAPFRVYRARQFPGALGSTPLSRHFAQQGVKLSIRAKEKPKGSGTSQKNDEEEDDDTDEKQDASSSASSMSISSLIHPN